MTKVHFNAGDALFWPRRGAIHYRAPMEEWEDFVAGLLTERRIEAIVLFGQCRRYHLTAIEAARRLRVAVYVFEEGYLRPWWITLERDGVNADSPLADVSSCKLPPAPELASPATFRYGFAKMGMYSFLYFFVGTLFKFAYPHYTHHRPFRWGKVVPWARSGVRKWLYRLTERKAVESLLQPPAGRYFLVPLQVQMDSQLRFHSAWNSNAEFIRQVISSFAARAPGYTRLVFKHHPMERGHTHYGKVIRALAEEFGVSERVVYIHDGHLPTLLQHARGVVVVNSTTGLQAMHHGTAVHVCGRSFYAKPGLVSPGSL
ncbi:MAG TPA: capsular biosynthesis protein, partial [Burkholderiaceae bacterium]|nr:capsular biosynthesis protein [Burkholderiaceae bacterium]